MNTSLMLFTGLAALLTMVVTVGICRPLLGSPAEAPGRPVPARRVVAACALALPLLATLLYGALGAPRLVSLEPSADLHRMNTQDMSEATMRLAQRLQATPDDLDGWVMLARSHQAMGEWAPSAHAYRRALALAPDEPQLMADLADVLATAQQGSLAGEPAQWIKAALARDPGHPKSLALAAMAAYRDARFDDAKALWEKLAAVSPPGSEAAALAQQGIARLPGMPQQAEAKPGRPVAPRP